MSGNKMNTPTSKSRSISMGGGHGGATRGFATRNPFEALEGVSESGIESNNSSGSRTSSDGSASRNVGVRAGASLVSPSQMTTAGVTAQRGMSGVSPQQMRGVSFNQGNMSSPVSSPPYRMPTSRGNGLESPATPRRQAVNSSSPRTPQNPPMTWRQGQRATQSTPSHESYGRLGVTRTVPTTPRTGPPSMMVGIPDVQAVQELAFRAGQGDHGVVREHVPASPFAAQYDSLWLEFYVLGKQCGGKPRTTTIPDSPSGLQNFSWTPLINPYTQDLQRPGGTVDLQWVRKICTISLGCMAALVATVCQRNPEWERTVCDVPSPVKQAIMHFPDLKARYETLQEDARKALAGGLPAGY